MTEPRRIPLIDVLEGRANSHEYVKSLRARTDARMREDLARRGIRPAKEPHDAATTFVVGFFGGLVAGALIAIGWLA